MQKRVIVTCGPSFEPIDEVRRITNFSTGTLGTELGNELTKRGWEVWSMVGHLATYRGDNRASRRSSFGTGSDLGQLLQVAAQEGGVGAVLHAAAVGDFRVAEVRDEEGRPFRGRKIPSREGGLTIRLEAAPKLITNLREWFPEAVLVGWKFELDGEADEAMEKAFRQIAEARTDACVVNGAGYGKGFGVAVRGGRRVKCASQEALFDWLARFLAAKGGCNAGGV